MERLDLELKMLTGRERNVLKKSAKTSSSKRIMRFVEPMISACGENKTAMMELCLMEETSYWTDN